MEKYYIICLEEKSREGTLLFWKDKGKGYTSDISEAGLFSWESANNVNIKGRDIALTRKELEAVLFIKIYSVADCSLNELIQLKQKIQTTIKNVV